MNIELKPIAEKKLEQMGATVHGVLVKDEAGAWAAVSEGGRVMRLDDFEGQSAASDIETERKRFIASFSGKSDLRWLENALLFASGITQNLWESCQTMASHFNRQAARAQSGQGAEVAADFRAEIRTEHDPSDEYVSYLALIADGKSHPYLHIPESLDQGVLGEALRRLNTHPQPAQQGSAPECPYPCGWDNLFKIIVENAANFARSTLEDEVPESVRQMGIDSGQYAIHLCKLARTLSTPATPQADGWVRCDERLPKHGQKVRTKDSGGRQFDCEYFHWEGCEKGYFKLLGKVWNHEAVLQWMPQPPAGQENSGDE